MNEDFFQFELRENNFVLRASQFIDFNSFAQGPKWITENMPVHVPVHVYSFSMLSNAL